ncbi:SigB/SigF/SigG family RNA polymerase sigma factor [Patulibacter defluvii]|uniref:SigB/SigF/SigG family RNA polymerase sigma factor n=1 Tax=Patulibacter defluvii TaxID=3095358 RepID=UPI002A761975|nr:SigB/SigF/SigG family RNA polymerase sigma factor [Patulibacter sp. DM4]
MRESTSGREQRDMQLLRRYHRQHDPADREQMVHRGLPLVRSLARPYAGKGEQLEDLVQVGCVGLLKAIDRFDPYAGTRFVTFAAPNITGEIKRHFRDHCWSVHVPRGIQELDARVNRAAERIAADRGRTATTEEIAQHLAVDPAQVEEAVRGGQGYRPLSLDHPAGEAREALDLCGEDEDGFAAVERRQLLWSACEALDEREREVVLLRFFDGRLQREIAERLGVSQMQVSRILRRALERMRAALDARDADAELGPASSGPQVAAGAGT